MSKHLPDEFPEGYLWGAFTDVQLSMIASHLADGRTLCCAEREPERFTIARSKTQRDLIAVFAHEALGCRRPEETDERWSTRSYRYLHNFLNTV